MQKTELKFVLRVAAVLLCISTLVAVLIASVHLLTKDKIAEHEAEAVRQAIGELFPGLDSVACEGDFPAEVSACYRILQDTETVGYCVYVASPGYGGDISMMVGVNADGTVHGVTIVSASETAGIGSKALEASHLTKFNGKRDAASVDGISGASISSRGVQNGVRIALELVQGGKIHA